MNLIFKIMVISSIACAVPICAAVAQTGPNQLRASNLDAGANAAKVQVPSGDLSSYGTVIAPGVVWSKEATFEAGYDSNPDELFVQNRATAYGRVGGNSSLAFVRPDGSGATVISLRGTYLSLSDTDFAHNRGDADFAIDNSYALGKGVDFSFGGYFLYDALHLVESEQGGGYAKLAFTSKNFDAYARVRHQEIQYEGPVPQAQLFDPATLVFAANRNYDVRRTEETAGFIAYANTSLGFFADTGASQLDYFNQVNPSVLDRTADEYWVVGGVRFAVDKYFKADVGYRYNERDFQKASLSDYSNSYPDAHLVWFAARDLTISFDVTRILVEPITTFALAGDERTFDLRVRYQVNPKLSLIVDAHDRRTAQIGDTALYYEKAVSLFANYDYTDKIHFYGVAAQKHVEESFSGGQYDRTQLGLGTRVQF